MIFFKNTIIIFILTLTTSLYSSETYSIKKLSLNDAITEISKLSKLPYILDLNILNDKKVNPIKNVVGLQKALNLMFAKTGVEALVNNGTIVVRENLSPNTIPSLDNIIVIGKQESYYEEYARTSMKGEFYDIETPYSTNVTNKTLINDIQALRIGDTYEYTTGVFTSDQRADGVIVRGFELDLQNIQVNGMPGLISRFGSPTTANVEKVEILKAPASVLYGSMETGGLINIITKKPQAQDKITISTSYSTFLSNNSGLGDDNSITTSFDARGTLKDGLYYRFIMVSEALESFRTKVEYDNFYIYPSLLWDLSDQTSVLFSFEYGKEKGSADDGLVVINNDISTIASINTVYQEEDDYDNDEGKTISVNLEHDFNNDSFLNIAWRSVFHIDERKSYENRSVDDNTQTLIRRYRHQYNERTWHTIDSNYSFKINIGSFVHNIMAGASLAYRITNYDRLGWGNNLSGINIYNPLYGENSSANEDNKRKTQYESKAIYFQDKIDLSEDLILVGSLRLDKTKVDFVCIRGKNSSCIDNKTSSKNIVASLGTVYSINPLISIYANIGQSYDPISAQKVDIKGEGLDSEESQQIEVGAKFNINEKFNTKVSIYKTNKTNVSERITDNRYELRGKVETKGLEIDLQYLVSKNWQIKAGYSYISSKHTSGEYKGNKTANNPKNAGFFFTRYNLPIKIYKGTLGVSSGLTYEDKTYTSASLKNKVELPSYIRWDMGLHYDEKDWSLSLNVENIRDEVYYEHGKNEYGIYAGNPRKITISFKKTF